MFVQPDSADLEPGRVQKVLAGGQLLELFLSTMGRFGVCVCVCAFLVSVFCWVVRGEIPNQSGHFKHSTMSTLSVNRVVLTSSPDLGGVRRLEPDVVKQARPKVWSSHSARAETKRCKLHDERLASGAGRKGADLLDG